MAITRLMSTNYPNWETLLSRLKPYSPNEDTNRSQSRKTSAWQGCLLSIAQGGGGGGGAPRSTVISQLGESCILTKSYSPQWGYKYAPIGEPLGDNDTTCATVSHRVCCQLLKSYSPNGDTNRPSRGGKTLGLYQTARLSKGIQLYVSPLSWQQLALLYCVASNQRSRLCVAVMVL